MIDSDGEYIESPSTLWLFAFGLVIIVIPTLWCLIVCMAVLRKRIIRYVEGSKRRKHLTQIPIIKYEGCTKTTISEESGGENRTSNTMKTINNIQPIALSVINSKNKKKKKKGDDLEEDELNKYAKLVNIDNDNCDKEMMILNDVENSDDNIFSNMSSFLLNTFQRKKEEYYHPHNDSCAICLEDFKINEKLRLLPCHHGFHVECVDPWLTKSSELCPMCKQSIFMNNNDDDNHNQHNGFWATLFTVCCMTQSSQEQPRDDDEQESDQDEEEDDDDDDEQQDDGGMVVLPDE
eukprot:46016_1